MGQGDTPLPAAVLPLLLEAPPVPEREAPVFSAQLEELVPPELLPPPVELETISRCWRRPWIRPVSRM